MNCPRCGNKTFVTDNVTMMAENYRRRLCKSCGKVFYTTEVEAEASEQFLAKWHRCHRNNGGEK